MRKIIVLTTLAAAIAFGQDKKRVAVVDFDSAAVQSSDGIFGRSVDVGKSIANLLVDPLVTGGAYSVIERKALDNHGRAEFFER
jgi:curli biogenesis system outer membrane secretion channel CsgG